LFKNLKLYKEKEFFYRLEGLKGDAINYFIANMFSETASNVLLVTSSLFEATKMYDELSSYNSDVMLFPMDDFLMSEALAASPELMSDRLSVISSIAKGKKIIVTNLMGYLRYMPTASLFSSSKIDLEVDMEIDPTKLKERLLNIGYRQETLVSKTGEIGVRGFIFDVFVIGEDNPIRIEFFGDTICSIRYFDVETQISSSKLNKITINPFTECLIEKEMDLPRSQKYLPLTNKNISNLYELLDNPIVLFNNYEYIKQSYLELRQEIFEYDVRKQAELKTDYMWDFYAINPKRTLYLNSVFDVITEKEHVINYGTSVVSLYNGTPELIKYCTGNIDKGNTIVFCLTNNLEKSKILELFDTAVLTKENNLFLGKINIIAKQINSSYKIDDFVFISNRDMFSSNVKARVRKNSFKQGLKPRTINKFAVGDYVVHAVCGIGIYSGIKTLNKLGIIKDYLQIEYKNGDKLYVPVEKIDYLSKYSSKEGAKPKINALSGTEWQRTKSRVKSRIADITSQLLSVSAARESMKGFAFGKDIPEQIMFEEEFAYTPTDDQLLATSKIKEDMESEKPMDRLLCGDVGFGKTEVAFRAIFKAVVNNKQVAYLCPTTILSSQQYNNAIKRFSSYPIKIALMNRFTSKKEQTKIVSDLKNGKIDIVFGTHRLLSRDISFKDLGLLIVDEEQRFGVTHKEKIKEFKNTVDILTLSATPIPRTLQMSLTGLRALSLIESAPIDRYPIQTYVVLEDERIIKDAIYKELSRSGQVFLLYNNVEKIIDKTSKIKLLVPEARVTYAHGQMSKTELENVMIKFVNKEFDVLVCTTIIETGIDIANANTLIIIDADKFGLSQLYQIRGRVGRTNKIAYAYLMYNPGKTLSEIAEKRLGAIKDFTELGSGFGIAMRDLSIRGAGDMLGSEQAGFIDAIGIDLYTKMLNDEIRRLNGEDILDEEVKEIALVSVNTHIPDSYVEDENLKIFIHKKINEIDSYQKLLKVKKELEDRFGKISEEILIYMHEEWFEKLVKEFMVDSVNQTKNFVEITLSSEMTNKIDIKKMMEIGYKLTKMFRLSYDRGRFKIILDTVKLDKHFIYYFVDLFRLYKEE